MNSRTFPHAIVITLLTVTLGIVSCKKEVVTPTSNNPSVPTGQQNELFSGVSISSSIGGEVRDVSGAPLSNAHVTVGTHSTYTNTAGYFYFTNISVDSDRAFVKVEKDGYFVSGKSINPDAIAASFVSIELIQKTIAGTINNSSGGAISVSGGPSITFEPGDVSLQDGSPYSGQVSVYASYLDPTASNIQSIIPGDLDAIDENGNAVALITYGMVAVELVGSSGQALNVTQGETVELSMPLQSVQQSGAPSSIPLWFFDETTGNWVEDGSADLQGNAYVGTVSHFTFWNVDKPTPGVNLKLTVSCNGIPNANVKVQLRSPQGLLYGTSYTNSNGEIDEMMPGGVPLILEVYDLCGSLTYTQDLGINNSDLDVGQITQCNSSSVITGTLVDCNGAPVSQGMFTVLVGTTTIPLFADANGSINTTITTCSASSVMVSGFDFNAALQSTPTSFTVSPTIDLGTLAVCDQLDEYILYTYDGVDYAIYDLGQDEVYANHSFMMRFGVMSNNGVNNLSFFTEDLGLGTYPNTAVPGLPSGIGLQVNGVQADPNTISVTYTLYGNGPGDYYEGTFGGNYNDVSGNPHTLTGSFRVK